MFGDSVALEVVQAVPVLVALAASALAGVAGVAIGAVTVAAAVGTVVTSTVLAGASYLLADKPQASSSVPQSVPTAAPANGFRTVTTRQAVPPRRFVLGCVRTAGVLFFLDSENPDLYVGTLLSDGEIEEVSQAYVGDISVPVDGNGDATAGSIYLDHFSIEVAVGTDAQTASTVLTTAFTGITSSFRQRGVARVVATLDWGADASDHSTLWGSTIFPSYLVKGVLAFDQREVAHDIDDASTWEYTSNPAWLIAFILISAWDVALDAADLDLDSFETAADAFDTTVTYNAASVKTFELAGIFQSGHRLADQLDDMLRSCGAVLTFSEGKYGLALDESKSSVWTVTDSDVLEIGTYAAAAPTDETPTAVKARFFDADSDGTQITTPIYEHAAVATEGYREAVLDFGFCPKTHSAQILAYRELIKARDGRRLNLTLCDAAIYLEPMDRVTLSLDNAAFLDGEYTVVQVDLSSQGVMVSLRGYVADAYADPTTYLV